MTLRLEEADRARLREAPNLWLATVTADQAAHLVPIWGVLVGDAIYMATDRGSKKVRNLRANPRAALSLPDPRDVLILEGGVELLDGPAPDGVLDRFAEKYEWRPTGGAWLLLRFHPDKRLGWNSDDAS